MCLLSEEIEFVAGTRIFARMLGDRQALLYDMTLATQNETAMVLPLPVPVGCPDDDTMDSSPMCRGWEGGRGRSGPSQIASRLP